MGDVHACMREVAHLPTDEGLDDMQRGAPELTQALRDSGDDVAPAGRAVTRLAARVPVGLQSHREVEKLLDDLLAISAHARPAGGEACLPRGATGW